MVVKVVNVEVEVDIDYEDLSPYDIAEWFDNATLQDLKTLHKLTNIDTDMIRGLCNE